MAIFGLIFIFQKGDLPETTSQSVITVMELCCWTYGRTLQYKLVLQHSGINNILHVYFIIHVFFYIKERVQKNYIWISTLIVASADNVEESDASDNDNPLMPVANRLNAECSSQLVLWYKNEGHRKRAQRIVFFTVPTLMQKWRNAS